MIKTNWYTDRCHTMALCNSFLLVEWKSFRIQAFNTNTNTDSNGVCFIQPIYNLWNRCIEFSLGKKDASVRYYTSLNAKTSFFYLSFLPKKTTTELPEILWEVHVGVSKLRCFQAETRAEIASPSAHNGLFFFWSNLIWIPNHRKTIVDRKKKRQ